MSGVGPPEFFADLRAVIDDARVEYRFSNRPDYPIMLSGQITQLRRPIFDPGLAIEIVFDTAFEAKALTFDGQSAKVSCTATAEDTRKLVDMIQIAQTQQSGLIVDIDLGHRPKADNPNHWYVTDVGVMLPNILV
jgi:hypothetical protein